MRIKLLTLAGAVALALMAGPLRAEEPANSKAKKPDKARAEAKEAKNAKDSKKAKEAKSTKDSKKAREAKSTKDSKKAREAKSTKDSKKAKEAKTSGKEAKRTRHRGPRGYGWGRYDGARRSAHTPRFGRGPSHGFHRGPHGFGGGRGHHAFGRGHHGFGRGYGYGHGYGWGRFPGAPRSTHAPRFDRGRRPDARPHRGPADARPQDRSGRWSPRAALPFGLRQDAAGRYQSLADRLRSYLRARTGDGTRFGRRPTGTGREREAGGEGRSRWSAWEHMRSRLSRPPSRESRPPSKEIEPDRPRSKPAPPGEVSTSDLSAGLDQILLQLSRLERELRQ